MSDVLNPSVGTVVDAAGKVTYDFDGRIHADGIDIEATPTNSASDANRMRFLNALTGQSVAELYTADSDTIPVHVTALQNHPPAGATSSRLQILAVLIDPRIIGASIDCMAFRDVPSVVDVNAEDLNRRLLSAAGDSDWVQALRFEALNQPENNTNTLRTFNSGIYPITALVLMRYTRAGDSGNAGSYVGLVTVDFSGGARLTNIQWVNYGSGHAAPTFSVTGNPSGWSLRAFQATSAIGNYSVEGALLHINN